MHGTKHFLYRRTLYNFQVTRTLKICNTRDQMRGITACDRNSFLSEAYLKGTNRLIGTWDVFWAKFHQELKFLFFSFFARTKRNANFEKFFFFLVWQWFVTNTYRTFYLKKGFLGKSPRFLPKSFFHLSYTLFTEY